MPQTLAVDKFPRLWLWRLWRAILPALLIGLLVGGAVAPGSAAAAAKKRTVSARKKPATARRTSARKPAAQKKNVHTRRARATRRRTPARNARVQSQRSPTPERLREIQAALQSNGFLDVEPNGKWDEASVSAMKRFQEEHAITPNGKINALSLIALGLGPKRGPAPGTASVIEPAPQTGRETPASDSGERQ